MVKARYVFHLDGRIRIEPAMVRNVAPILPDQVRDACNATASSVCAEVVFPVRRASEKEPGVVTHRVIIARRGTDRRRVVLCQPVACAHDHLVALACSGCSQYVAIGTMHHRWINACGIPRLVRFPIRVNPCPTVVVQKCSPTAFRLSPTGRIGQECRDSGAWWADRN